MDRKRPPAVQKRQTAYVWYSFSDLLFGNGLLKPFPNDKCAGDSRKAAQEGAALLIGTQ